MKISSYLHEVTARIKGDEAGIIAAQNERKSMSAVNGQISSLEGLIVDQEESVKDAEELLNEALYPTTKIIDNQSYIRKISQAQQVMDETADTLENTKKSLKYFQDLKAKFSSEVEA